MSVAFFIHILLCICCIEITEHYLSIHLRARLVTTSFYAFCTAAVVQLYMISGYFARFVQQCSFSQTQHLMAQETPAQIVPSTHPVPILDVLGRLPVRKVRDSKTIDTHLDLLLESAVAKLETSVKKMEKFARAADIMAPERLKKPLSRVPLSICCKFPAVALVRSSDASVESKVYKCLQRACNAVPICPTFYLRHLKTTWPCGFLRSR